MQYAPGSGADQLARVVSDAVQKESGSGFVIRNLPGALAVIGTSTLVKSPADGYTVGICSASVNSIAPSLFKSLPYDPGADFTFIEPLAAYTYVVSSAPELGFAKLDDLVQHAQANPTKLSYVYANATAQVLAAALARSLRIQALAVPYKAAQEGLADMSQNRVSFGITDVGVTVPMVKSARVKPLAVISARRSASLPDVPSLAEQGRTPPEVTAWAGLCGPRNMPPEAVTWLRQQVRKASTRPEVLEKLTLLGLEPLTLGTTSFADFVARQLVVWTEAAREAGIRAE